MPNLFEQTVTLKKPGIPCGRDSSRSTEVEPARAASLIEGMRAASSSGRESQIPPGKPEQ